MVTLDRPAPAGGSIAQVKYATLDVRQTFRFCDRESLALFLKARRLLERDMRAALAQDGVAQ